MEQLRRRSRRLDSEHDPALAGDLIHGARPMTRKSRIFEASKNWSRSAPPETIDSFTPTTCAVPTTHVSASVTVGSMSSFRARYFSGEV
ncbi:hypothetical protein CH286_09330 [Rhodococcus sp. WWJCD1]|nr:hypothetical protein CH286_09330 [Rhodococcus sp. WWJCD1]OZE82719.1 hypothetical protein CH305_09295 [Rhodococcus sp. 15-649-2-2]